jgi:type IV pilus assembly protein PilQ
MKKSIIPYCFILLFLIPNSILRAQDRFVNIENRLQKLAQEAPGLNEKVELSVNGITIQEFLRGLASSNNLNISIDPTLNTKIYNNFTNVKVIDVLMFLCRRYDLEVTFIGNIISIGQFAEPPPEKPKYTPKIINAKYDLLKDQLSYDLSNDSLTSVAKELTKLTQKNMVFAPDLGSKTVSGFIQNMKLVDALDKLAFSNDLKITPGENGTFLFEKADKEEKNLVTNKSKQTNGTKAPELFVKADENKLISVVASSTPIVDLINTVSEQMGYNYFLFSEPKGVATLTIEKASYDDFLKYLLNGSDYTFKKENGIYLIGERGIESLRSTRVIQLKYRTVDKIMEFIPGDLKKNVEVKEFSDQNSLIVCGSAPRIEELSLFLMEIDKVVPVIVIEVLIAEVRKSKSLATGIEAGLGDKSVKTGGIVFPGPDVTLSSNSLNELISGLNGFGLVNLGSVTPNFYVKLKALESQGVIKLKSTPKLSTLNGNEAKMSIGSTQYYVENTRDVIGSQNPQTVITQQFKPVEANFSLGINPIVSGDEQITMKINVKQSNFTERISPSAPPGKTSRDFESMIRVKNGETIILGGLEENSENESGSGFPVLSRIPIIKWFFSSRTRSKSKTKLTVFIKATVIY